MGAFFIPFGATGEAKFDLCARRVQRPSSLGHCRAVAEATKHEVLCESRRLAVNPMTEPQQELLGLGPSSLPPTKQQTLA